MLGDIGLQSGRHQSTLADIELQHARVATEGTDGLRDAVGFFSVVAAVYHNIVTVAREPESDGFADSPARSGYQHALIHAELPAKNFSASAG
jgi:hypothetical protein